MDSFLFPQYSRDKSYVQFALFRHVENSQELRKRIIKASTLSGSYGGQEREALSFAFINARLVTSRLHLQTAINQALLADSQNALRTKMVHSEIIWALNPTNNITEALRRYGISDTCTNLLVVRVGKPDLPPSNVQELMKDVVIGTIVPFTELENVTDWVSVKKYHKLDNERAAKESLEGSEEDAVDNIAVSTVAMKSVTQ